MDFKKIQKVLEIMKENDLSEFTYEEHDKFKLSFKSAAANIGPMITSVPAMSGAPAVDAAPVASGSTIDSPLVGTYYGASSPESPDYVKVGDTISPDDVVCIVEAMKVMNEVKAEVSGVITKILVGNADPVEYGQPIFEYKPA